MARTFAGNGWDVLYISAPITPFHILKLGDREVRNRISGVSRVKTHQLQESPPVTSYIPFALLGPANNPVLNSSYVIRNWTAYMVPPIRKILERTGFDDIDLFYTDNFYHWSLHNSVKSNLTLYHMADNYSGFPGYSPAFADFERTMVSKTDLLCYPSSEIKSYIDSLCPRNISFVPNGVDFEHFQGEWPVPDDFPATSDPVAVYVGAVEAWFDFDLFDKLAMALPNVMFVVIGGGKLQKITRRKNIQLLGERKWDLLPGYLKQADVGIIPFDVSNYPELIHPVRPLKLIEYMASGLPVVSTRWRELEKMESPALLANNADQFIENVEKALDGSAGDVEACRHFARENSWAAVTQNLIHDIEKRISGV